MRYRLEIDELSMNFLIVLKVLPTSYQLAIIKVSINYRLAINVLSIIYLWAIDEQPKLHSRATNDGLSMFYQRDWYESSICYQRSIDELLTGNRRSLDKPSLRYSITILLLSSCHRRSICKVSLRNWRAMKDRPKGYWWYIDMLKTSNWHVINKLWTSRKLTEKLSTCCRRSY